MGATSQEVTVQANVETVQTANSTVGTVVASKTVTDLPLTTRNYVNLLSLTAGSNADVTNANQMGRGSTVISVNGAASNENNFQQDGVAVNNWASSSAGTENGFYGANPVPNPDAIQEFKIQTSSYDAGYGRNPGANVNVVTKSGTNQFHGTLFEFLRNTALNANEFFYKRSELLRGVPNQQAVFDQNQYGGVLGGPIKKDKVFAFVSYQETQQRNGLAAYGLSTAFLPPIPSGNRGNCTAANGGNPNWTTCADPAGAAFIAALGAANAGTSGVHGAGGGLNTVAANGSNINPIAINILQLKLPNGNYYVPSPTVLPAPGKTQQVTFSDPATYKEHQLIANTDFVINSKNTLSTRSFLEDDPYQASFPAVGASAPYIPGSTVAVKYPNDTDLLKLTTLFTSNVVNEARVSYQRNQTFSHNEIPFTDAEVGITTFAPPSYPELAQINIANTIYIGGAPFFGIHLANNSWQAADQISWQKGRNSFRFGGEFGHNASILIDPSGDGAQTAASTFADFLIGTCASLAGCAHPNGTAFSNLTISGAQLAAYNGDLVDTYLQSNANAFIQDDFKVNSRLTLNLGLRWEWDGFPKVEAGETSNLWQSLLALQPIPGSTPATGSLVGYMVPANWSGGPLPAGVFQSNHSNLGQNQAPLNDFAPRVGFAWTPLSGNLGNRFVVRGGAGLFYEQVSSFTQDSSLTNDPYAITFGTNPLSTLANPNIISPTFPGPPGTPGWLPRYVNFATNVSSNIASSYNESEQATVPVTYEWNLETQYEFAPSWVLEVGYVGSRGIHQTAGATAGPVGGVSGNPSEPLNVPQLASSSNPLYCGYDGNPAHCITTNSAANTVVRVPYLGIAPGFSVDGRTTGDYKFNSLQVTVRKNFSHGLQLQAAYTYARSFINYWSGNPAAIAPGIAPVISLYGPNGAYHPQHLVVNYSWDLPFGKHEGFLGAALGGWTLIGVTTLQDGEPLTFTSSTTGTAFASQGTNMAVYCPGMGKGNIASSGSTEARVVNGLTGGTGWVNPGVFAGQPSSPASCTVPAIPAALGSGTAYGDAGLGQILGPGQDNWDMALAKVTRVGGLSEGATLQIRGEFFNTFNHPQFDDPAVNTSLTSLGQVSVSSVNPRLIQFGIKYVF